MRVLSLGAGVQSSTLLLMAVEGELEIDRAVFADTQDEPTLVYEWLGVLRAIAEEAGIPVEIVSAGSLSDKILHGQHAPSLPVFTEGTEGRKTGILGRQCTRDFKIRPIRRYIQKIRNGKTVDQLLGISLDEVGRMRDSDVGYIRNVYPLVDLRMTRLDCMNWLTKHDCPVPPKSACVFCPYHSDAAWRWLRDNDAASWDTAVDFDLQVRDRRPDFKGGVYLHRSLVPLGEVDLSTEQDHGQLDLFGNECAGVCGV